MEQLKPIVAELLSLGKDLRRQAAEFRGTAERAGLGGILEQKSANIMLHLSRVLEQMSAESLLIADSLVTAVKLDDGGTALRVLVPNAHDDALMAAALLMVASHDLLVFHGALELSQQIGALSDRMEAVMLQLESAEKELPLPAREAVN